MKFSTTFFLTVALVTVSADQIRLNVHPMPDDPKNSLIWFNISNYDEWSQKLDTFLEPYRTPSLTEGREEHLVSCSYDKYPAPDSVCKVKVEDFKPCVASDYFGYKRGSPCVFIEFEKLLGWKPRYYTSTKSLSKTMPQELREDIKYLTSDLKMWQNIWLSCEGETPADKEFIGGTMVLPQPGFPGYHFPYTGQKGYLNPVVAVHFVKPLYGIIINIECKAWAPGIVHDSKKLLGMSRFQFLIDIKHQY